MVFSHEEGSLMPAKELKRLSARPPLEPIGMELHDRAPEQYPSWQPSLVNVFGMMFAAMFAVVLVLACVFLSFAAVE
jgi:hypothetical protein